MRPECAALLALADPRDGAAEAALARLRTPGDRRRFVAMARGEGATGHLYFELLRRRLTPALAPTAAEALREDYEGALRVNALRHADLHGVLAALARAGVAAQPSGVTLLAYAGLVPTRGVRPWPALTLTVHSGDPAALDGALAQAGFRREPGPPGVVAAVNARATPLALSLQAAPVTGGLRAAVLAAAAALDTRGPGTLGDEIDRLYLSRHPAGAALSRAPFADRPGLARALERRYAEPGPVARLRAALFPPGPEMVKAHGPRAAGFGLYRLYAQRLLRLPKSITAASREDAGAP